MSADAAAPTVLITVGDEILSGHTQDTNSQFLARAVFNAGYPVRRMAVVPDDPAVIAATVREALAEPGVHRVVVSGGIGPTPDDRTLGAVAEALDRPLEENEVALRHIQGIVQRMHDAGWVNTAEVSAANRRSAMVPRGAQVLPNRRGMAPPLAIDAGGGRWLFVLPGIPRELTAIVEEELIPRFFADASAPAVAEVRYSGVPEAELSDPMRELEREFPDVTVGSYPQTERGELVIRLRGRDNGRVEAAAARLLELKPANG